jgi:polysaccharide biosynthesis protein PelA
MRTDGRKSGLSNSGAAKSRSAMFAAASAMLALTLSVLVNLTAPRAAFAQGQAAQARDQGGQRALGQQTVYRKFQKPGPESAKRTANARQPIPKPVAVNANVNRSILALFDGGEEKSPDQTRLHRLLEMPLNHLGYQLTYWDIRNGLPPLPQARNYRAVATWFDERIPEPAAYLSWARSIAEARVRFIVMDFIGTPVDAQTLPAVNAFLGAIGLSMRSEWVAPAADLRVVMQNDAMIGFERKLDGDLPGYMVYRASRFGGRPHVAVGRRDEDSAKASHPVVTGPGGGIAAYGFTALFDPKTERMSWILNPFEFLKAALGSDGAPIPDTTTLVGRRIYFSHIDGDGWNTLTHIQRPDKSDRLVSEVVLDDLIKAYPDLPVSVGLIAGDVDLSVAGKPKSARVAREYFRLPQVEVASHSYTHPYNWGAFASPEASAQAAQNASSNPLLAYGQRDFDLNREVGGALDYSAALAPAAKRPGLYLWSGNTSPFAGAIRATRAYGVRNLNGGDSRFDKAYPSHAYLSGLSRQVDGERQIYSGNANETIYTSGWTAPFDRFKMLEETLRRTETPRRLKPFNVYYHMYSGERPESVAAVQQHLEAARAGPVVPIAASHYAAIADAFFDVTITAAGPDSWRISKRGALQTLRFDGAASRVPDYVKSSGVLGHSHHAGSLYVSLDPGQDAALVTLARDDRATALGPGVSNPGRPILVDSRWPLAGFEIGACGFEVTAQGFGPGQMTWAGLRPGPYTITATRDGQTLATLSADADQEGQLSFSVVADAIGGVRLAVQCKT